MTVCKCKMIPRLKSVARFSQLFTKNGHVGSRDSDTSSLLVDKLLSFLSGCRDNSEILFVPDRLRIFCRWLTNTAVASRLTAIKQMKIIKYKSALHATWIFNSMKRTSFFLLSLSLRSSLSISSSEETQFWSTLYLRTAFKVFIYILSTRKQFVTFHVFINNFIL